MIIFSVFSVYLECKFDMLHVVSMALSAAFGVWYLMKKVRIVHSNYSIIFRFYGRNMTFDL